MSAAYWRRAMNGEGRKEGIVSLPVSPGAAGPASAPALDWIRAVPARHVVLTFPLQKLPPVGQRLALYRHGVAVGQVKVSGPQREDNIVADLIAGEAEVGDEVRSP